MLSASAGVLEIFGEDVQKLLVEMTELDEAMKDICAEGALNDELWKKTQQKIDAQMHSQIQKERRSLDELGHGVLERFIH